jgi:hypothetical protein
MCRRYRIKCLDSTADLEKFADMAREVNLRLFGDVDVDDSGGSDGDNVAQSSLCSRTSNVPLRLGRSSKPGLFKANMGWRLNFNLKLVTIFIVLLLSCASSVFGDDEVELPIPLPSNENERSE